jgi:hypothetical protein
VPIAAGPASPEQVSVAATPPKAVAAPQELDQDEIAMKGGEDPPARNEQQGASTPVAIASSPADSEQVPIAAGPASPEQVSVAATPPKAVAAPQELDQDEIAMKGGEDPSARNEQQGPSSHEKRAARKRGTAPTRNKENAKASARQRAPDASAYVDHQHDVRHRSQWTRTRDHQGSDREFIEADGFRHIILPRRPSEPNEDIPAWLYALPRTQQ